jgi:hypothetical protein
MEAKIFMFLAQNFRHGLLPRETTDVYSVVSPHTLCNQPMHTDVAMGAFVLTGKGDRNFSEPPGTQERNVEFGKPLNPTGSLPLPPWHVCPKVLHAAIPDFWSLYLKTGGLRSIALAVTRCEVLADGVVGHVAWFA